MVVRQLSEALVSSSPHRSEPGPQEAQGQTPSAPMPTPSAPMPTPSVPLAVSPATRLQRWCVVGLSSMHEAMVRRLALQSLTQHHLVLQWQSFARWEDLPGVVSVGLQGDGRDADPSARFTDPAIQFHAWDSRNLADVIIMEVGQLRRLCVEMLSKVSQLPSPSSSDPCIRLVWSWGGLGRLESLETIDFIVPMSSLAHGLIHNDITLSGWIRSAAVHARNHPSPPHPLLQGLSLPSLAL
jgi:hypothetical protein